METTLTTLSTVFATSLLVVGALYFLIRRLVSTGGQEREELIRTQEALQSKTQRASELEIEVQTLSQSLREKDIALSRAETQAENLKDSLEAERKLLETAEERLKDTFKSLASSALEGSSKQFLDLAKSQLNRESEVAKKELEKTEQSIENLVKPLSQVLEKYHGHVDSIEKQRQKSYFNIESELKKVIENTAMLSSETIALKNALKKPHVRGRWGEVQLKNCVELAGMSEFADVTFQDTTSDTEGRLHIPDMTVRMPGGRLIVVDSKTPIDAFLSSLEATTEEERTAEMARHGRHVKDHVKKLSSRAYTDALENSPDFTVMFLPNESFLYAALESEPDLMEYALQKKVLITTPPTLIGLLKVIRFGWNEEKLAENAIKISEAGTELHKRLVEFVEGYVAVGKSLEKAKAEYDKGLNRLERRLVSKAREMEQMGIKSSKDLPEGMGVMALDGSEAGSLELEEPPQTDPEPEADATT